MIRKFAVAMVALSSLSSSLALALGLGEAKVNSALNQPLDAEIQLVNVRDLSAGEIISNLAAREDFEKAGVERVFFLQDVKFKVVFKDANTAVIKMTSTKAVREPFLNFLVEVVWPSGRLLREYALLIDPPMYSQEKAAPVQPARVTAPAPQVSQARTQPAPSYTTPARPASTPAPASTATSGGTYGPTQSSDTLWDIATAYKPAGDVSTQQTMLAIQDLNPDAFLDNNINLLKAGQVLRLPTLDDAQKRSRDQAISTVRTQNRAFAEHQSLGRRQLDASRTAEATAPEGARASGDELKLMVAKGEGSQSAKSAQAGSGKAGKSGSGAATAAELAMTQEKLDKANRENDELQSRMKDLQGQLETLQRLVKLKDDQLANLQVQAAKTEQPGQTPQATTEVPQPTAETQQPPMETAKPEAPATAPEATQPPAMPTPETTKPSDTAQAPVTTPEPAKPAEAPKPKPKPVKQHEPGFIEQLVNNPIYQAIAAGIAVLLLGLLWLLSRHNAKKEQAFHEKLASSPDADDDTVLDFGEASDEEDADNVVAARGEGETDDALAEADIYVAYGRLDQAAKILEDSLQSDPNRVDTRSKLLEVYAQSGNAAAFDRHLDALRDTGDDDAIARAEQLRTQIAVSDEEPAVSLDDLENQLLSGRTSPAAEDELDDSEYLIDQDEEPKDFSRAMDAVNLDDAVSELDDDFAALDTESATESVMEESDKDNLDIDFDVTDLDLEGLEEKTEAAPAHALSDLESIDFDIEKPVEVKADLASLEEDELADFGGETAESLPEDFDLAETAATETQSLEDELELGDLDLGEAELTKDLAESTELADEATDFSEEELSLDEIAEAPEAFAKAAESLEEMDLSDLEEESLAEQLLEPAAEIDEETGALADEAISGLESEELPATEALSGMEADLDEEDFDFLAGTDEAATKLDLARAYIDMGDTEGARDILEEVAQEGNDQQKQEASELLNSLA